jgi:carotenoid 1,2-hydratase
VRITTEPADAGWHDQRESGAYEWWYLDALSDDGSTAIVAIWFAGLPFSPDYLTDHERGRAPSALDHVAMFAAVYRDGRQVCYTLNRYPRTAFEASRDALQVRIGPNLLAVRDDVLEARLDVPLLGGSRLTGQLALARPGARSLEALTGGEAGADHMWNPLEPDCRVDGRFEYAGVAVDPFRGRAYVDHNYGRRPLTEGIKRWHWGRAHLDGATVVYYHTEPETGRDATLLAVVDGGAASTVDADARFAAADWRRRILCPRYPTVVRLDGRGVALESRVRSVLDWGPFYMRFLADVRATVEGQRLEGPAITEYFDPRGLRARILRPLIKTRITRAT